MTKNPPRVYTESERNEQKYRRWLQQFDKSTQERQEQIDRWFKEIRVAAHKLDKLSLLPATDDNLRELQKVQSYINCRKRRLRNRGVIR